MEWNDLRGVLLYVICIHLYDMCENMIVKTHRDATLIAGRAETHNAFF